MNIVLETLTFVFLFLFYILEAILLFFVPASLRYKNVKGQLVLITGAGSGIGRIMAHRFAKLGANVVLIGRSLSNLDQTAAEIKAYDTTVYRYQCDVSKREEVYRVAEIVCILPGAVIKEQIGAVDILVNNAGVVTGSYFLQTTDEGIINTMNVNAAAHFWTVKSFLPAMLERDHGHIVSIASIGGFIGISKLVDYSASKFAAVGFIEALRLEIACLGKKGVKTTLICPFYIDTGMFAGVKSRFSLLLPMMDPGVSVDRIMSAILTNQEVLLMPRILYLTLILKSIVPTKVITLLLNFVGANGSMTTFQGNHTKGN